MTLDWYPVIDYKKCIGCMQCYEFCPHDVFRKNKKPKVVNRENCIEFCKGCGKICEQKAIKFFGDDGG